jgi:hypothetical protein
MLSLPCLRPIRNFWTPTARTSGTFLLRRIQMDKKDTVKAPEKVESRKEVKAQRAKAIKAAAAKTPEKEKDHAEDSRP